jgi:hypothetical protein
VNACDLAQKGRQILTNQRFTAGEPHFANAGRRRSPDHPLDFVKRQDVRPGLASVRAIRHAVKATNVAPIGDTDPEAVVNAPVPVYEVGPGENGQCRLHYPHGCKPWAKFGGPIVVAKKI